MNILIFIVLIKTNFHSIFVSNKLEIAPCLYIESKDTVISLSKLFA